MKTIQLTFLAAVSLVFFEWLFYFTKQSFMTGLATTEKLLLLLNSAFLLAALALAPVILLSIGRKSRFDNLRKISRILVPIVPTILISTLIYLLVDNFTYTLFHFGTSTIHGARKYLYALAFAIFASWIYIRIWRWSFANQKVQRSNFLTIVSIIFAALLTFSFFYTFSQREDSFTEIATTDTTGPLPNIFIISADGVLANRMSTYGAKRNTTPFITHLAEDSLVFENSFTNAANTGGSITSMLTGKLPMETKVVFPPDILRGKDAFEHLPRLLKILGYKTKDISVRHYADPYDLNLLGGFDESRAKKNKIDLLGAMSDYPVLRPLVVRYASESYFLNQIGERITSRLLHSFGLIKIVNPYSMLAARTEWVVSDDKRVQDLVNFIDHNSKPLFAHVHLMDTHGPTFKPKSRRFSGGQKQIEQWMLDFYDDALLDYDGHIEQIIKHLRTKGLYENSLIILTSDHGMRLTTNDRLPLIIKFPQSNPRGIQKLNAQRLDIAPTILAYLGLDAPNWMKGTSLIVPDNREKLRPIFSSHTTKPDRLKSGWFIVKNPSAPFYSLGSVTMVICNKSFRLTLESNSLTSKTINDHTLPCDQSLLPSDLEARKLIVDVLLDNNYSVPANIR